jgi:hypothetical protein
MRACAYKTLMAKYASDKDEQHVICFIACHGVNISRNG